MILPSTKSLVLPALCLAALWGPRAPLQAQTEVSPQPTLQSAEEGQKDGTQKGTNEAKPSQALPQDAQAQLDLLRERLETAIRRLKSLVTPAELERELRLRKPEYRTVKVAGSTPEGGQAQMPTETAPEAPPVDMTPKRSRVLGDSEKASLAADALMTVDGMPIFENEVKELADYFASYRKGSAEDHRRAAIEELLKIRTAEAHFADRLDDLKQRAQDAHAKAVQADTGFDEVAGEFSQCPSAAQGGSLGTFGRDQMAPSFARHAFTLGVGRISPVFASPFGYHFLKVQKKMKGESPAEDRVEAAHVLILFAQDRNLVAQLSQRALQGASDIAVRKAEDRELLPEVYR